jgi:TIR domain/Yip1 domain
VTDIVISYASADRPRVKPLVEALKQRGWSVWWDRTILAGKTFDRVIEMALKDSRCVIVLWSTASVESDWVWTEADEGKRRAILVPAMLDSVNIPFAFRRVHTASLIGWAGALPSDQFDELARAVSDVLSNSETSSPDARSAQETKQPNEQTQQLDHKQDETEETTLRQTGSERLKQEEQAAAQAERKRLEREQQAQAERERLEREKQAQAEQERLEQEKQARDQAERLEQEKNEKAKARFQQVRKEADQRSEREKQEQAQAEYERLEREKQAQAQAEQEQLEREQKERTAKLGQQLYQKLMSEDVVGEERIRRLRTVLELSPDHMQAMRDLAAALHGVKRDYEAAEYLKCAIHMGLRDEAALKEYAEIQTSIKNRESEQEEFSKDEGRKRLERERVEQKAKAQAERERLEREKNEKDKARLKQVRQDAEQRIEQDKQQAEQKRLEREKAAKAERERLEDGSRARAQQERAENESKAQAEQEPGARGVNVPAEQERVERENQAQARTEQKRLEQEQTPRQSERECPAEEKRRVDQPHETQVTIFGKTHILREQDKSTAQEVEAAGRRGTGQEAARAGQTQVSRIINIFWVPSKTFKDIGRRADWWAPWILISVFSLAFIFTTGKQVGFEQINKNQIAHSKRAEQFDKLPADQQAQQLQLSVKIFQFFAFGSPLLILFYALISTVAIWATFKVGFSADTTFGQAYAIGMYAKLPGIIGAIFGIISLFAGVNPEGFDINNPIGTNLAYYLNQDTTGKFMRGMASSLDVLVIWSIVLVGIGFASTSKVKRSTAIGIVAGWYLLYKLITSALA